jgi:tetratricopeptide (TPR) repeat protein
VNATDLTQRGMQQAQEGDLEAAISSYDEAICLADHLPALLNRACAYYHLGDYERAARDSSWALEVDEERHQMWLVRGMSRSHLGDDLGASQDLNRYLELARGARYRRLVQRTLRGLQAA